MSKIIPIFIILISAAGAGGFYGGMKYEQSKNPFSRLSRQDLQNLPQDQRQQLLQGNMQGSFQRGALGQGGASFVSGEVIAKDNETLTVKMPDGGSRIIFLSDSTAILKTAEGSMDDIQVGEQVMINGQQNSDGNFIAKSIQERQPLLAPNM